jgi:hypothetical protein
MRTVTTSKLVYSYDKLPEDTKQKALENLYDINVDYSDWYDLEDFIEVGKCLGITVDKVYCSGFSSQGDGACFEGFYQYRKQSVKAIKSFAPQDTELHRIAQGLQDLQRTAFYQLCASVKHRGHYYHEFCTEITVETQDNGYATADQESELSDLLRDYMRWIYRQLNAEYDYCTSREAIEETIACNSYEFDENGNLA